MSTLDPMIGVGRDGTRAYIRVTLPITGDVFDLRFDTGHEWSAKLLVEAIRTALMERMRRAREEAYLDGYRHGKGKRAKDSWFTARLP